MKFLKKIECKKVIWYNERKWARELLADLWRTANGDHDSCVSSGKHRRCELWYNMNTYRELVKSRVSYSWTFDESEIKEKNNQNKDSKKHIYKEEGRTSGGYKSICRNGFRKDRERCGRLHLKMRQRFILAEVVGKSTCWRRWSRMGKRGCWHMAAARSRRMAFIRKCWMS